MKQCNTCHQLIDDNAVYCPYCKQPQMPGYAPGSQFRESAYQNPLNGWTAEQLQEYFRRNNAFDSGPEGKSRGIFAILAIFLGGFGVQYFYLNKITGGLLTILLTLVTCGAWELMLFIQGIIVLCQDNRYFHDRFVMNNSTLPLF